MKSVYKLALLFILCFPIYTIYCVLGITPVERAKLAYEEGQRLELAYEFQKAADYYKEAIKQDKKNPQYHYKLAFAYNQLKPPKINDAIDRLKQIVKIDPGHKESYSLLGQLYLQKKDIKDAELAFGRAMEIDKKFAEPYFFIGGIFQQKKESQKAIEYYQNYIKLAVQGEYTDTAQERLRELAYGDAGVKLNLAILAMRNLEYNRGLMIFNSLLQQTPSSESLKRLQQEVHYWRGRLYLIPEAPGYDPTGKKSEREWLNAPDALAARMELGEWYCQIGETQKAISQLLIATN
ncbi:tetratricopeptide repeat protein, partial [Candidatus Poribacteria bacterium]|nr:tetratricopeptide repeat protein [Candidatus Poribacteria bacterium]